MSHSRASNSASLEEVTKCLRANFTTQTFEIFRGSDQVKVVSHYQSFLFDLLTLIGRPCNTRRDKAVTEALEGVSRQDASYFAAQITSAVQYCRSKSKSITSGNKTVPAVAQVAGLLNKPPDILPGYDQILGETAAITPKKIFPEVE